LEHPPLDELDVGALQAESEAVDARAKAATPATRAGLRCMVVSLLGDGLWGRRVVIPRE